MPFRKLPEPEVKGWEWKVERCKHPEHEPPTMRVLEPGLYEWTCPACGGVRTVRVAPRSMFRSSAYVPAKTSWSVSVPPAAVAAKKLRVGWRG